MSVRRLVDEKGQALVEFALLVPVLLLIVGGIIQFGKAFSYWSQTNNIAAETARRIVVDRLPPYTAEDGTPVAAEQNPTTTNYRNYIHARLRGDELRASTPNDSAHIKICFTPATSPGIGDEVKVIIKTDFDALPFVSASFKLTGSATMRIEQTQTPTASDPASC